jgi:hypothetical protein
MSEAGTIRRDGGNDQPELLTWLEMPVLLAWPETDSEHRPPLKQPSRVLGGLKNMLLRRRAREARFERR